MSPSCWNLQLVSNSGSSGSDLSSGSVDISWVRFLFHLLTSLLAAAMAVKRWKFGSGSPPNNSFSLLTINTADEKAALSWPDLAWEVAGRMQSHPKSWIPHLSGEAAALTVGCPLQPEEGLAGILSQLPGKQPSVWKTGHHLQENNNTVLLFLLILIERMIYGLQHN